MSNKVLEIKNLTKKYNNRIVVDDLTLTVFEGEIFGFLGANGAGKSTTMKMITGLAKIDSGDIFVCGKSIKTDFENAIINVGGVIENPEMYKNFSGLENLNYFASLYENVSKNRIKRIVELVGLSDRIKDKVKTYSLGMKQRLGIAQSLLHKPKLLILDEPTNGLDPEGIINLRRFLKKISIKEKISILISSHNIAEMELICDTVGIINNGVLVEVKSIDQYNEYNNNQQIIIKVNFPNFAGKLISEYFNDVKINIKKNVITVDLDFNNVNKITQLLVSKGILIYSISCENKTLEDIFLETINKKALPLPKGV